MPVAQFSPRFSWVVIHLKDPELDYNRSIRAAVSRIDRDISFNWIRSLEESMSLSTRILKTLSELFVAVAIIALVLAGTGIYGVVSRSVLLRTREMGIRRALGQTNEQTIAYFLKQGARFLIVGAVLGGAGAITAAWLLTSQFPSLLDSIVIIVIIVAVIMTGLVFFASYLPARRMLEMEPAVALHHE